MSNTNADIPAASAVPQAAREEAERRWPLWRNLRSSWDARAMQAAFVDGAQWQADQPSAEPTEAEIQAAARSLDGYDSTAEGITQSWGDLSEESQQHYLGAARAALVAAREVSGR